MKKVTVLSSILLIIFLANVTFAQGVKIGPRLTGNLNIYNQDRLTGTWNGVGIGIGGCVDILFSKHIGILTNITAFDMKNFSNSQTNNNATTETSLSLAYLSIDPFFKAEFSGFYLLGGFSVAVKISSSGEQTTTQNGNVNVQTLNLTTNSVKFDLATGFGYNFDLGSDLYLGSDMIVYIPLTNTFDSPGTSNGTLSIKLGASLKFRIN
jgi:hypothetical protein